MQEQVKRVETTVGRAMLFEILPAGLPFDLVNRDMTKKAISKSDQCLLSPGWSERNCYFC